MSKTKSNPWQVVAMIHNGAVRVVSEHKHLRVAQLVEWFLDGTALLAGRGRGGWHYDLRRKPAPPPAEGLAGRCKHGEQMLNQCLACEVDELRNRASRLEAAVKVVRSLITFSPCDHPIGTGNYCSVCGADVTVAAPAVQPDVDVMPAEMDWCGFCLIPGRTGWPVAHRLGCPTLTEGDTL